MDHVHGAHGAAGVVKDPFLLEVDVLGVLLAELGDDEVDDGLGVLAVRGNGAGGELVQLLVVKDVKVVGVALDEGDDGGEDGEGDGEELHPARDAARGGFVGGHGEETVRETLRSWRMVIKKESKREAKMRRQVKKKKDKECMGSSRIAKKKTVLEIVKREWGERGEKKKKEE